MKRLATIAAVLAAPLLCACDTYQVTVLPFDVVENNDTSYAALTATNQGRPTYGQVRVQSYLSVQGAPQCRIVAGYANPVLYIAKEIHERSPCLDAHVREHEQKHVAIYRAALVTLKERIESHKGPVTTALQNTLLDELDVVLPKHAALDSDSEYQRNNTACRGALVALLGKP